MISLTTAKFLLFIALSLGPKVGDTDHTIEIVGKNCYVVWTQDSGGWTLTEKTWPCDDWSDGTSFSNGELKQFGPAYDSKADAIASHQWSYGYSSSIHFADGDVVEKQGSNKVFYTINAGAPNEQVFSIQAMEDGAPL